MKFDFLNWLLIHARNYFISSSFISSWMLVVSRVLIASVFSIISSESSFISDELFCDLFIGFYFRFFAAWFTTFELLLCCFIIYSKKFYLKFCSIPKFYRLLTCFQKFYEQNYNKPYHCIEYQICLIHIFIIIYNCY